MDRLLSFWKDDGGERYPAGSEKTKLGHFVGLGNCLVLQGRRLQGVGRSIRRDAGRNRNFHFRTGSSPAPYAELGADSASSLAHA